MSHICKQLHRSYLSATGCVLVVEVRGSLIGKGLAVCLSDEDAPCVSHACTGIGQPIISIGACVIEMKMKVNLSLEP